MILIDAIVVKIRDGQVANRPIYVAMGVNLDGERDVLGMWVGPTGGEGAKFWMTVLTELRNRGIADTFIVCCDGLKGLPESIRATWPLADVQLCVVHLVRSSLRYTSKKHWGQVCRELREIYTAPTVEAAEARFAEFAEHLARALPGDDRTPGNGPGTSSCRSSSSPSSCARSSTRPTPSSRSTPGSARRSATAATSRPSRPR